jgi:high-affinity nickel permease
MPKTSHRHRAQRQSHLHESPNISTNNLSIGFILCIIILCIIILYPLINIFPDYRAELTTRHVPETPFIIVTNSEGVMSISLHQ